MGHTHCISTPTENWTHVYMNLFTRNSSYYHLLKCLLFLLKHPVYLDYTAIAVLVLESAEAPSCFSTTHFGLLKISQINSMKCKALAKQNSMKWIYSYINILRFKHIILDNGLSFNCNWDCELVHVDRTVINSNIPTYCPQSANKTHFIENESD